MYKVTEAYVVLVTVPFGWTILELIHGVITKRSRREFQRVISRESKYGERLRPRSLEVSCGARWWETLWLMEIEDDMLD